MIISSSYDHDPEHRQERQVLFLFKSFGNIQLNRGGWLLSPFSVSEDFSCSVGLNAVRCSCVETLVRASATLTAAECGEGLSKEFVFCA